MSGRVSVPGPHWRPGDPPAFRRFASLGGQSLELGGWLPDVTLAFETHGQLNAQRDNAILIEHALTGDAHVTGPTAPGQITPGWWDDLVGPGRVVDTDRWFVVAANVLGGCQGSTGPASPASPTAPHEDGRAWGSRWPRITIRDQVAAEVRLADRLGIGRFAAVIGGSMGGMRALEWVVGHPERVARAALIATGAQATADQIGTQTAQIRAITSDPDWRDGDYLDGDGRSPRRGLSLARQIAHLTYRTETELQLRFGARAQAGENPLSAELPGRHRGAGRFAVQSYLDHHGQRLADRFDPGSYVALTDAMSTHNVARGRGSLPHVLGQVDVPVVVAGVASDRLYPLWQQEQLADLIPTADGVRVIESVFGHDGFLVERAAVGAVIAEALGIEAALDEGIRVCA